MMRKNVFFRALEKRYLLDAAAIDTAVDAIQQEMIEGHAQSAIDDANAQAFSRLFDVAVDDIETIQSGSSFNELVFIDSRVKDPQVLLETVNPAAHVFVLDATEDGVTQISKILNTHNSVGAVHIVSHGQPGELLLGSSSLTVASMRAEHQKLLSGFMHSMDSNADILIYGCDFGAGETGSEATLLLSVLTGADIAASVDDTGGSEQGGDWDLESRIGSIETSTISAGSYRSLLAPVVDTDGDSVEDLIDIDDDNDGILDTQEKVEKDGGTAETAFSKLGMARSVTTEGFYYFNIDGNFFKTYVDTDGYVQVAKDPGVGSGDLPQVASLDDIDRGILEPAVLASLTDATEVRISDSSKILDATTTNSTIIARVQTSETLKYQGVEDNVINDHWTGTNAEYLKSDGNTSEFGSGLHQNIFHASNNKNAAGWMPSDGSQRVHWESGEIGDNEFMNLWVRADAVSTVADTDGDGIADHLDLDSDNDGISDLVESGTKQSNIALDTSNNGSISVGETEGSLGAGNADVDADGLMDIFDASNLSPSPVHSLGTLEWDFDSDGLENNLDLDSDNDGIADAIEGRLTAGFVSNDGDITDNDLDGDGVIDIFDANDGTAGGFGGTHTNFNSPVDTDGDGTADYLDPNSDSDGVSDADESGLSFAGIDSNVDGIDDDLSIGASYTDPDGVNNNPSTGLANEIGGESEVDFREPSDVDGDSVEDFVDIDDDNDGILDTQEKVEKDGGTAETAFSKLGMARSVTTEGFYYFNIDGNSFKTYVDTDGYVQVAKDPGDGSGNLPQVANLDDVDRGILEPVVLASLTEATEVRISDSSKTLDATTTHWAIIARVQTNETLKYQGYEDNGINDDWTGTNAIYLTGNGLLSNNSTELHQNIFHSSGNGNTSAWIPSTSHQRVNWKVGEIGDNEFMNLWVRADAVSVFSAVDTDGDGIADHLDLDSDNDGISDLVESGTTQATIALDTSDNGSISVGETEASLGAGNADADTDGLMDIFDANSENASSVASLGTLEWDFDSDGLENNLDLDSDNDGIADTIEGRLTAGFVSNDGDTTDNDLDGDGVIDIFDANDGTAGGFGGTHANFNSPVDTDGDGTADYLDPNSDSDGVSDAVESGLSVVGIDSNVDGIDDDASVGVSYSDPDGAVNDPSADLANEARDTSEVAYREIVYSEISLGDAIRNEAAGTITFEVTLDKSSVAVVEVDYATSSGTATSDTDFVATTGKVTFAVGETSQIITVNITDDAVYEGSETFNVTLSSPVNGAISDGTGIGTIIDDGTESGGTDDDRPTLTVSDVAVTEGADTHAVFTVNLSNASNEATVLTPSLTSGTATTGTDTGALEYFDGTDWLAVSGDITIAAGQTSLQVRTAITDDALNEASEDFTLVLAQVNGTLAPIGNDLSARATVADDDAAPALSIADAERNEAAGTMAFTVTLDAPSGQAVAVDYTAVSGTASSGVDFTMADGTLNFAAGQTTKTITVNITDDAVYEGSETFNVTLSSPVNGAISDGTGIGTIIDDGTESGGTDDDRPTLTVSDVAVTEGADTHAVFTVNLSNASNEATVLTPSLTSGTATTGTDTGVLEYFDGTDWLAVSGDITIAAGQTSLQVRTAITDDALNEASEDFTLVLAQVNGTLAPIGNDLSARATVADDDAAPALSIADAERNEAAGTMAFTVTLDAPSGQAVAVDYTAVSGTASSGVDFTMADGTLNFAAGQTTKTITVNITDDTVYEGTETFVVNLSSASKAAIVDSTATGTITDDGTGTAGVDNDRPVITIADASTVEGDTLVFDITASNPSVLPIVLGLSAAGGTATDGGDFETTGFEYSTDNGASWLSAGNGREVTIPAGSTAIQVRIDTLEDSVTEQEESLTVAVSSIVSGPVQLSTDTGSGTIGDNDTSVASIAATGNASEQGSIDGVFTVTLSAPSSTPTEIAYSVTGSADGGSDFAPLSGVVTVAAGATSATIAVPVIDDAHIEGVENLIVTLDTVMAGDSEILISNTSSSATLEVTDNDASQWSISGTTTVSEGEVASYVVALTGTYEQGEIVSVDPGLFAGSTSTVDYASMNTAVNTAVNSYNSGSGDGSMAWNGSTLTWTAVADDDSMDDLIIELGITNDAFVEGEEDFSLSIGNAMAPSGANVSVDATADTVTTTVADTQGSGGPADGPAEWSLSGAATGDEGESVGYAVALAGSYGAGEVVSVDIGVTDTDTSGSDHGDLIAAITSAANANTDVTFDPATGTLTYTAPSDGASMADLNISLALVDDGWLEGTESYKLGLSNATSATGLSVGIGASADQVTTEIQDTQGVGGVTEGPGEWAIAGAATGEEGVAVLYNVSLSGSYGAGEVVSVVVKLVDNSTNSGDYTDTSVAITNAANANPDVSFDPASGTLTFTSPHDGASMADLSVSLAVTDDGIIEGPEDYSFILSNAKSTSGVNLGLDVANNRVVTTIDDTPGFGGGTDGPAEWSVTGASNVDEGATATYLVNLSGALGAGESVAVDLTISDIDTGSNDYASFAAAVTAAVDSYTGDGTVAFDGTALIYTANSDGDTMTGLALDLALLDDLVIESAEQYTVVLSNATSSTGAATSINLLASEVTSTINAATDNAIWSITGPAAGDEGANLSYTVALTGAYGGGTEIEVDLSLVDISTNNTDHSSLNAAVTAAVADYNGSSAAGSLSWNGTTLRFVASVDGDAMSDLSIVTDLTDDAFAEGPERFTVALANATATGVSAQIDGANDAVSTTINDTQGVGGATNGPIVWGITGATDIDEGDSTDYRLTLSGALGAGEVVFVDLSLVDIDTDSTDHANVIGAINSAVGAYTGSGAVSFDASSGTIAYTANADGDTMSDLLINLTAVDDSLIEGLEDYTLTLANPASGSGFNTTVDSTANAVTTTVNDTAGVAGATESAQWQLSGVNSVLEGTNAGYSLVLTGTLQAGETAVVQLNINDGSSSTADYSSLVTAVETGIVNYTGSGSFTFNATTHELVYTSAGVAMAPLAFELEAIADSLVEGGENYSVAITGATSTTGSAITVNSALTTVNTTIRGDDLEAIWQINGTASVDEGGTAGYTVSMVNAVQAGEVISVELSALELEAGAADYASFLASVQAGVDAYTGTGALTFDQTSGQLDFTSAGDAMADWSFTLQIADDTLIEGQERLQVLLASPTSTTGSGTTIDASADDVLTTIMDTVGDGGELEAVLWSIGQDQIVAEGEQASYVISLSGTVQSGEVALVELTLADIDTSSADYADFNAAITAAVAAYGGPGSLNFDVSTGHLEFTSDGNPMADLPIVFATTDDSIGEGTESFMIALRNPASSTGIAVLLSANDDDVTTTIDDTTGAGADEVLWAIKGATDAVEGAGASYTLSLDGLLAAGESTTVDLKLGELETGVSDHELFSTAVQDALTASGRTDIGFDATAGTITFTSTGVAMADFEFTINTVDDNLAEGGERYEVSLTNSGGNAGGTAGVLTGIKTGFAQAVTTIRDSDSIVWSLVGDSNVDEGGVAAYTIDLFGILQAGERVQVALRLANTETGHDDYSDLAAAVQQAIGNRTDVSFDATTGILEFTGDGNAFAGLDVSIVANDDAFVEGPERYRLELVNAGSDTGSVVTVDGGSNAVVTTINDTIGAGGDIEEAVWSIDGDTSVNEGGEARYTIALSSLMQAGESASVVLAIDNIDTSSSDYEAFYIAVGKAVVASGRADIGFDVGTGTLTFYSTGAAMDDIVITVAATDDAFIEGSEDYRISLGVAYSTTGASVVIDSARDVVATDIVDTQGAGGDAEGPGLWSVTGAASGEEGETLIYTVALGGSYGAGEIVTVNLRLDNGDTSDNDYTSAAAAISAAVATNSDVSFDAATGTLTYIAPADGASMADLHISLGLTVDSYTEGVEIFHLELANATSTTAANVAIEPSKESVATSINDQNTAESNDGPGLWSISGAATGDEGETVEYTVSLAGVFGHGEVVTADLALTAIGTSSNDYADTIAAISAAAAMNPDVTFDATTRTLSYTSAGEGGSMADLVISVPLTDDGFIEGPESFSLELSNTTSSTGVGVSIESGRESVTTTINDTQSVDGMADGPGHWSITGPYSGEEGSSQSYVVALSGHYGGSEIVSVDLGFSETDTHRGDYADYVVAISTAADLHPDISFDPTAGRLSYTSPSDGASMADLVIDLSLTDDDLIEGPEEYTLALQNAVTATGAAVVIEAGAESVSTTIDDTQGEDGKADGPGEWSITGPAAADEDETLSYTVALSGKYGVGEVVTVNLGLNNIDTGEGDYDSVVSTIAAAAASNPDVSFDTVSGTLVFIAPVEGASMSDLVIDLELANDGLIEGSEVFEFNLADASSSSGANVRIETGMASVTTTINDTRGGSGTADGSGEWSINGAATADEGEVVAYTISLNGRYGTGETVSVDIGLGDADTSSGDYIDIFAAITTAAAANPDVNFNPATGTLTYTSPANGASMSDLPISLTVTNDEFIEGAELFELELSNPFSSTAVSAIALGAGKAATTIEDTRGVGGAADGPGEWAISGPSTGNEGDTIGYVVSLSGRYGAGQVVSVDLGLTDSGTSAADYADIVAAVIAAASASPDVSYNPLTGTLTYIAPTDGASMADLQIGLKVTNDNILEGGEEFELALGNATGSIVNAESASLTTIIADSAHDNFSAMWSVEGPAVVDEGSAAIVNVALSGAFGAGEVISVALELVDVDTDSDDYGDFVAAVETAIASNPELHFNANTGTLSFHAAVDGASMPDLQIILPVSTDSIDEAAETLRVRLTEPAASSEIEIGPVQATQDITIVGLPVTAGVQNGMTVTVDAASGLLANETDVSAGPMQIVSFTVAGETYASGSTVQLASGELTINFDGSFTFRPEPGYTGDIPAVIYEISNGRLSRPATLSLGPIETAGPDAIDDEVVVERGFSIVLDLLGNDNLAGNAAQITHVNGQALVVGGARVSVDGGFVHLNSEGLLVLESDRGSELRHFEYTVTDDSGRSDTAGVTLVPLQNAAGSVGTINVNEALESIIETPLFSDFIVIEHEGLSRQQITSAGGLIDWVLNAASSLGFRTAIASDGAMTAVVNDLGSLGRIAELGKNSLQGLLAVEAAIKDQPTHLDSDAAMSGFQTNMQGGSLWQARAAGTDDGLDIESHMERGSLVVTLDTSEFANVQKVVFSLANGEPLPDWISTSENDFATIHPDSSRSHVSLMADTHFDGVETVAKSYEVELNSGPIQQIKPAKNVVR